MSQVGKVLQAGSTTLWQVGSLQLAVEWTYGQTLYLTSFPWPGNEQGVRTPVGTAVFSSFTAADRAARAYIAGLPE